MVPGADRQMMTTLRCSRCGISYPNQFLHQKCSVCGEKTNVIMDAPDDDWQKKVALANKHLSESVEIKPDKVEVWRTEQLVAAGFLNGSAAEIAANQQIDLHKAVELAQKAGPELAYRILT